MAFCNVDEINPINLIILSKGCYLALRQNDFDMSKVLVNLLRWKEQSLYKKASVLISKNKQKTD